MKAWKASAPDNVVLEHHPAQQVGPGQVKLKMLASAIGDTELMMYQGKFGMKKFPIILGRQGVGMVSEVGEGVTALRRGDRVYVRPQTYCGECSKCTSGRENECEHVRIYGKTIDGLLCDFVIVPADNLYKLPDRVSNDEAVFLELIALAKNTIDTLGVGGGKYIIVSGASCLGLLIAQTAIYYQAIPIVVDVNEERLAIAEKLGIYYTVNVGTEDFRKKIFAITGGKLADAAVYTLPAVLPVQRLFDAVMTGGKAMVTAIESTEREINVNLSFILEKNVTLGMISSVGVNVPAAINMLISSNIKVQPFISKCPFEEVDEYLEKCSFDPSQYMFLIVSYDQKKL